jgi:hypothetical protein
MLIFVLLPGGIVRGVLSGGYCLNSMMMSFTLAMSDNEKQQAKLFFSVAAIAY